MLSVEKLIHFNTLEFDATVCVLYLKYSVKVSNILKDTNAGK